MRRTPLLLAVSVAAACGDHGGDRPDAHVPLPDEREPCASSNPLRNPYFGDLHVHTAYSFDAAVYALRNRPEDAYAFARGEPVGLPPYDAAGNPTRTIRIDRPLDFVAVTDHAEFFGETVLCRDPASPAYESRTCRDYRASDLADRNVSGLFAILAAPVPRRPDFCATEDCLGRARGVWERTQEAAEEAYDRTAACSFTTFVGYEWSGTPLGNNLHRNVLFRNRQVPAIPSTYLEAPWPEELWRQLDAACLSAGTGCDALAIPHNSNLSSGQMFVPLSESAQPFTVDEARRRARMEPLVEIYQHKGSSECMPGIGDPLDTEDELCAFENAHRPLCAGAPGDSPGCTPLCSVQPGVGFAAQCADPGDFVRTALGAGLVEQARVGANPFALGFVGGTDTHNGAPGGVDETAFVGHAAESDDTLAERLERDVRRFGSGGLAAVWAEENSRESIFAALRRRETYATSGPRMTARFFGGWSYPDDLCDDPALVEKGYAGGVSMGGELPPRSGAAPRLVVAAARDPGTAERPGLPLRRAQIVKGWLQDGVPRYDVFDVAGDPGPGAGVDPTTCEPTGAGFDTLCAVFTDPSFDPAQPAFYYARILENPTCRWSARQCLEAAVDCASLPAGDPLEPCCDGTLPSTIEERAWTSPIWYVP